MLSTIHAKLKALLNSKSSKWLLIRGPVKIVETVEMMLFLDRRTWKRLNLSEWLKKIRFRILTAFSHI